MMDAMTDGDNPDIKPIGGFVRLGLLSMGVALMGLAVGFYPTYALGGPGAISAMLIGMGIALFATLAGLVPQVLTLNLEPRERQSGVLAGTVVRFILTLGLLLPMFLTGITSRVALALWTAIGYIVLLAVDVAGLVWLMKRSAGSTT
jgi:hypothetical protein